ncbi:TonB-dependent receptor [Niabella insulamsoli]|uniref:TonB-dependent receptor n=1 Tax=Niabella insulamsoli TaxID=3144874 RepID=UPI0031FBDA0B
MKQLNQLLFALLFSALFFRPSAAQVVGRVVDENSTALPAVTVMLRGTTQGTTTDSSGLFRLFPVPRLPFNISVSAVGFETRHIAVRNTEDTIFVKLQLLYKTDTVVVTSRRRNERSQNVPIALSVVGGKQIDQAGAFNITRVKEMVPSLQMYTSNPRNTGINIRGLGAPFGLTNDGLDPGVGYYVDGVYYARPAIATLDFIDVERIEVLRGPQGTLFGKNTTSGAISITTRKPRFAPGGNLEVSYGNYGFIQAKASVTGPLSRRLAARLSFSGTQRDGIIKNITTDKWTNDLNNLGLRSQLLFRVSDRTSMTLSGEYNRQKPDGYAQVVAGVVTTKRADYRQFDAIISDLNYKLPNLDKTGRPDAFMRIIDHDTPWNSGNEIGGLSFNVDKKIGNGMLTATTAWRYWNWNPSNDRDFTGLQALAKSQNPSQHKSLSQELRYAGAMASNINAVVGLFYLRQQVTTNGTEEAGKDQWRFSKNSNSSLWETEGLLTGYGITTDASIVSQSAAMFLNIDWEPWKGFHIQPGARYNYDEKIVAYARNTYGGLDLSGRPDSAFLRALKNTVYTDQSYHADAYESNFTYQLTMAYQPSSKVNTYATFSTSYKPVGVNVSGVPSINGAAATNLAVILPEATYHYEWGVKTRFTTNLSINLAFYRSDIKNYQTNVQSAELGVNRGYIANADKVRVSGIEADAQYTLNQHFSFSGALSYARGIYVKFSNAPLPLEETGATNSDGIQVAFKDISGEGLPGISRWSGSVGGEYATASALFGRANQFFVAFDFFARSGFSSSPTPSAFLNVPGYGILNLRLGFRASKGFSVFGWGRNVLNKNYFEQLLPAGGNAGHYVAVLGDPQTYGVTLTYAFH